MRNSKNIWKNTTLFVFIILWGCASSKVTHSWVASDNSAKKYNKILVLALIKNQDRDLQEKMENHLAGDLNVRGFNTIPSFKTYGPKSFEIMNKKEAFEKLKGSDIDAVMTVVLLDKQSEYAYHGDPNNYVVGEIYRRRIWGYYGDIYSHVDDPNYYLVNTEYFWESSFYDVKNDEMIYSVQTKSFNPASTEALAHEYGKLIVKDMVAKNVLSSKSIPQSISVK